MRAPLVRTLNSRKFVLPAAALFAAMWLAAQAEASPIIYTDRDAFLAASSTTTLFTMDNPQVQWPYSPPNNFPGFIVTYQEGGDSVEFLFDISGMGTTNGSLALGTSYQSGWGFVSAPVLAFGFDVLYQDAGMRLNIMGQTVQPTSPFVGVVSDTPLTPYFSWSATGGNLNTHTVIDNMLITTVPEPTTLLMTGLGCAALTLTRRLRGRK
jgi:hypothetical protein